MTHGRIKKKKMVTGSIVQLSAHVPQGTFLLLPLPRQTFLDKIF